MAVEWKKLLIDGDQADNFTDLDDTPASLTGEGGKTVKVNSGGDALEFVDVAAEESKVKVSSNDTTPGYLDGKLIAGAGIALTEGDDAGDETLEAKISDGGVDTTQLAADAVDGTKLADGAVGSEHIEQLDAALDFGGQQAQDMVLHTVANSDARDALTPVVGKMVWQADESQAYICISAA
ncbi:unnamed protein product [marine sediment metagenome]|uniref:Major tropism determinant N-terminal domain-containing protein n=1 Tax=marine sediment metagenome TaxID=412755 RepID=X1CHF5_9ZZZZ